jgi:hypothetical protein
MGYPEAVHVRSNPARVNDVESMSDVAHRFGHLGACSCCDCDITRRSDNHFHHQHPKPPIDLDGRPFAALPARGLPTVGPDALFDMAAVQGLTATEELAFRDLVGRTRVGDFVKLCFLVEESEVPWLPHSLRHLAALTEHCLSESMWVRVTGIEGTWPDTRFRGELWDIPVLIDPAKLRSGSSVTFEVRHIHTLGMEFQ